MHFSLTFECEAKSSRDVYFTILKEAAKCDLKNIHEIAEISNAFYLERKILCPQFSNDINRKCGYLSWLCYGHANVWRFGSKT